MSANDTIRLTVNIKDKTQPITIEIPSTMTPKEVIEDLQAQGHVPKSTDRNYAMTHAQTNLQPQAALGQQGVRDQDAVSIVWDGKLARNAS